MQQFRLNPQPLGIFPLPVGYLILPLVEQSSDTLALLLKGEIPVEVPLEWRFYMLALAGDLEHAYDELENDNSPEAQYNRFVLQSSPSEYVRLNNSLEGEFKFLLQVVAYTLGYIAQPPAEVDDITPVLAALVLMAQATYCLELNEPEYAITLLERAVEVARPVSPIFAAQLLGTLADTKRTSQGSNYTIIQEYQEAIRLLESSNLAVACGELWLNLGIANHELAQGRRSVLLEAARCYQEALQTLDREKSPELFAMAQSNLALAYLAMPLQEASDRLRVAIAVQALRAALEVYRRETHPEMWASTQLNLANALVYLPSGHPEDNLVQAVEIYEELLGVRSRENDPAGYARLLANQGNVLSHLGIFNHAISKLQEAITLFESCGEAEAAASVAGLLEQLELHQTAGAGLDNGNS
ncbi:hypothetical protein [Candidatus Chlorohelix sp.]|uniref:hypothetical protein n=1 Tax=Candidatus Chlorohelix sp. TaxID=3139201 RepID=UPI00303A84E1